MALISPNRKSLRQLSQKNQRSIEVKELQAWEVNGMLAGLPLKPSSLP